MKLISFCTAAVLLSSNVFAQAKPSDLAPTPVTHPAAAQAKAAPAVKAPAAPASKKVAHHGKKGHKHGHASTAPSKKKVHTASAKTHKNDNKSVVR